MNYKKDIAFVVGLTRQMVATMSSYDYMGGFNAQEGSLIQSYLDKIARSRGYNLENGIDNTIVELMLDNYIGTYFPQAKDEIKVRIEILFTKVCDGTLHTCSSLFNSVLICPDQ